MNKVVNKYISIRNEAQSPSGEIHIEGDIVDNSWWDDDVTPKSVVEALKEAGSVKNLDVYVNSYGGSCIAGNSIVNIIDEYRKKNGCKVNVYIRGIAASMGSGISTVGDKVSMASNALYMIHKPSASVYGNANDLEKTIEVLDKTEHTLVTNYMRKFNGTEDELRKMMADETWLTAEEAKGYGFVDEITDEVEIAASAKGIRVNGMEFDSKVADLIKNKCPETHIKQKEDNTLNYDEKLGDFGIDKETFDSYGVNSETVMAIADLVKNKFAIQAEKPFIEKASVCEALECDDITAEQLIDFAKAGKNPPVQKPDPELVNKAEAYEKILVKEREKALKNAVRAQGSYMDEARTKKMLDALDYEDIVAQSEAWNEQAKEAVHAGTRVSKVGSAYKKDSKGDYINPADCMSN